MHQISAWVLKCAVVFTCLLVQACMHMVESGAGGSEWVSEECPPSLFGLRVWVCVHTSQHAQHIPPSFLDFMLFPSPFPLLLVVTVVRLQFCFLHNHMRNYCLPPAGVLHSQNKVI